MEEESSGSEGAPAWMTTFADLATLLLTFFVLLLSFANMDVVKFRELRGSLNEAFGYQQEYFGSYNPRVFSLEKNEPDKETQAIKETTGDHELVKELQAMIQAQQLESDVKISAGSRGIVVRIHESVAFEGGGAKLAKSGYPVLTKLGEIFRRYPHHLLIEGHTDDTPARSRRFPSNWELSTARATSVLRYFVEVGGLDPRRLGVAGYADMRPLVPNDTPEHRDMNRRVEFVCHRDRDLGADTPLEPVYFEAKPAQ